MLSVRFLRISAPFLVSIMLFTGCGSSSQLLDHASVNDSLSDSIYGSDSEELAAAFSAVTSLRDRQYRIAVSSVWPAPRGRYYYVHLYASFLVDGVWTDVKHWKVSNFDSDYISLTTSKYEVINGRRVNLGSQPIRASAWCRNWYNVPQHRTPDLSARCHNLAADGTLRGDTVYVRLGGPR